jgi:HSP20 family protein
MAEVRNQNNPQQQNQNQKTNDNGTGRAIEPSKKGEMQRQTSSGQGQMGQTGQWGGSPFSFMRRFMSDMDRLFGDFGFGSLGSSLGSSLGQSPRIGESWSTGMWAPQIDVFERDNQLIVHADLPGLKQEDVHVSVSDDVLTISGERSSSFEQNKGGYYQNERSFGTFQRCLTLPEGVNAEQINASFDNGVLEVSMPMPKQQQQKGRTIPIGTKGGQNVKH